MHPEIARAVMAERVRDRHRRAGAGRLARLASRAAVIVADCRHAQRGAAIRRAGTGRYLLRPDQAPADYLEFLARTAGPLRREPAAADRLRGRPVR